MKPRVITGLLLLAAALAAYVVGLRTSREVRLRQHEAEQGFLDFLVANAHETFSKAVPSASPDVVLVSFDEKDREEYSAWPPAPIDYIMLLKRLLVQEPEVVVFTDPLRWEPGQVQFATQLRQALLPVPSVVLGFDAAATAGESTPEQTAFIAEQMPRFAAQEGSGQASSVFARVTYLPDKTLRIGTEFGLSRIEAAPPAKDAKKPSAAGVPFVARHESRLVPSVAAQAVTRYRRMPFSDLRLRFGTGARLSLSETHMVPLDKGGALTLLDNPSVPKVDALELVTPMIDEAEAEKTNRTLGKGKVIVIGTGPHAESQARAVAYALAMPRLHRAPLWAGWAFAGWMALCCLRQWRYRRFKVLLFGVVMAAVAMIICMLTFQSSLWWWSPVPAAVVLVVNTLFCFLWPRSRTVAPAEPKAPAEEAPASGGTPSSPA